MRVIHLDASGWRSEEDFYSALLPQLGAPSWHGRNLNALDDSLYGGVNQVDPPFRVEVRGAENLGPEMHDFLSEVATVFNDVQLETKADISFQVL